MHLASWLTGRVVACSTRNVAPSETGGGRDCVRVRSLPTDFQM